MVERDQESTCQYIPFESRLLLDTSMCQDVTTARTRGLTCSLLWLLRPLALKVLSLIVTGRPFDEVRCGCWERGVGDGGGS